MCSCTTHHWLARPVTPREGDQAVAGHCVEHLDAVGAALAGALAIYDRRVLLGDHTSLLIEVAVDAEVAAWLPITPTDGRLPDRDTVFASVLALHGRLLRTDVGTSLPELPATAAHVDLDPAAEGDVTGIRTPGAPGPSPWS